MTAFTHETLGRPTRYDGPTGIVGVLQEAAGRAELDALSFWVHVPHYANNPPCPKATLALLHRIEDVLDLPVPMADIAEDETTLKESYEVAKKWLDDPSSVSE